MLPKCHLLLTQNSEIDPVDSLLGRHCEVNRQLAWNLVPLSSSVMAISKQHFGTYQCGEQSRVMDIAYWDVGRGLGMYGKSIGLSSVSDQSGTELWTTSCHVL